MSYTIVVNRAMDALGALSRLPKKLQRTAIAQRAEEALLAADWMLSQTIAEGAAGAGARICSSRGACYEICQCQGVTDPPQKGAKGYCAWRGLVAADTVSRKALLKSKKPGRPKGAT